VTESIYDGIPQLAGAEPYVTPVLHPDRIRECAQVCRDYRVRIGGSGFEWADITGPLAGVLDEMAVGSEELVSIGFTERASALYLKALVALLEAIESAVRHT